MAEDATTSHTDFAPAATTEVPKATSVDPSDSAFRSRAHWERPIVQRLHTYSAETKDFNGDDGFFFGGS